MSETHRITVDPGQCGGRHCLRDLRIRVRDVLDLLAANGHEAAHVGDLGMQSAPDATIRDHALASSSAIVTKDEDFLQRKVLAEKGPVVVWIRLPHVVEALARGETLIEVT
jgi:predicted nuclease of predicted toxin-antitoxin system